VKNLLAEYRGAADDLVDRLIEKGDLIGEEVIDIIGRFEERQYGERSHETRAPRTEERMLGGLIAQKPAAPGQAAAPRSDMFHWGQSGRF